MYDYEHTRQAWRELGRVLLPAALVALIILLLRLL